MSRFNLFSQRSVGIFVINNSKLLLGNTWNKSGISYDLAVARSFLRPSEAFHHHLDLAPNVTAVQLYSQTHCRREFGNQIRQEDRPPLFDEKVQKMNNFELETTNFALIQTKSPGLCPLPWKKSPFPTSAPSDGSWPRPCEVYQSSSVIDVVVTYQTFSI